MMFPLSNDPGSLQNPGRKKDRPSKQHILSSRFSEIAANLNYFILQHLGPFHWPYSEITNRNNLVD